AGKQIRLGAHQVLELGERDGRRVEVFWIGPEAHDGASALLFYFFRAQLLLELAAFERDGVALPIAEHGDFAALGERIRHGDADAVQAAGDVVDAIARARELAAGVQHGEGDLDRGLFLFLVHVDRDAATLVLDFDRAVLVHAHADLLAVAGERLVDRVVDRLL